MYLEISQSAMLRAVGRRLYANAPSNFVCNRRIEKWRLLRAMWREAKAPYHGTIVETEPTQNELVEMLRSKPRIGILNGRHIETCFASFPSIKDSQYDYHQGPGSLEKVAHKALIESYEEQLDDQTKAICALISSRDEAIACLDDVERALELYVTYGDPNYAMEAKQILGGFYRE